MLKVLGGEQEGEFKAVASGTLPNGKPVVVNSDGTVSVAGESSFTEAVGTAVTYDTAAAGENEVIYDSNAQKIVITYRDTSDSNRGHAVVGTVNASNNSISFGTPVQFTTTNVEWSDATYDPVNNKVVIAYADSQGSRYGYAIVGDVSGTSISFGSATVFNAYEVQHVAIGYAGDGKVVIVYEDWGNSNYGMAIVGTISGTSISFGTEVVCESARIGYPSVVYDPDSGKVVIGFSTYANAEHGYAKVGTVSGTSISFGSKALFQSSVIQDLAGAYDSSAQKVVFCYRNVGGSYYGTAVAGTVSGTSISFGSSVVFNSTNTNKPNITFDANVRKVVIGYRDVGNSLYGTAVSGTVSGTSITFDPEVVINAANSNQWGAGYDASAKKVVFAFYDSGSTDGEAVVYQPSGSATNLTAGNYIGMSQGEVLSTPQSISSLVEFDSSQVSYIGAAYDSNAQKIVVVYKDHGNSNQGTAIVGTVANDSITFGTPVVYETGNSTYNQAVYMPDKQKVFISYRDEGNNNAGMGIVGTVSGNSISFGSAREFVAAADYISCTYDTNSQKVVVSYRDPNNSSYGTSQVITITDSTVSFGSKVVFKSSNSYQIASTYDANAQKVVIAYSDATNSQRGKAVVGTVSGTSISFGTQVNFNEYSSVDISIAYDASAQKVVIAYMDEGNSDYGTAIVGTVSGTSISYGDPVVYNAGRTPACSVMYNPDLQKTIIAYKDQGNSSYGTYIEGTVSGTSISFGDESVFNTDESEYIQAVYDTAQDRTVVFFMDGVTAPYTGQSVVIKAATTNRYPVADGSNVRLDIIGSISKNQNGLTAGEKYYVQSDGTIDTTAGSPSVLAGTAISSTELLVKT